MVCKGSREIPRCPRHGLACMQPALPARSFGSPARAKFGFGKLIGFPVCPEAPGVRDRNRRRPLATGLRWSRTPACRKRSPQVAGPGRRAASEKPDGQLWVGSDCSMPSGAVNGPASCTGGCRRRLWPSGALRSRGGRQLCLQAPISPLVLVARPPSSGNGSNVPTPTDCSTVTRSNSYKALGLRRSRRRTSGTCCGLPGVWFCRAWVALVPDGGLDGAGLSRSLVPC